MLDGAEADIGRDAVLVGDLTAGIAGADMPEGVSLAGNRFVRRLSELRLHDRWRQEVGGDAQEWTWTGTVNPYRIDHAFGTPGAALPSWRVHAALTTLTEAITAQAAKGYLRHCGYSSR